MVGEVSSATDTEPEPSARRTALVERAVEQWKHDLIDLGGRNNLLHYRELKLGTLELTGLESRALVSLLRGHAVRVTSLFDSEEEADDGLRRVRTIYAKAKENLDERGVETLHVAYGLATWDNQKTAWDPLAPVLIRHAELKPLGAVQDEFELRLTGDAEVNPSLLQVLATDFDCEFDPASLAGTVDGEIDEEWEIEAAYKWLSARTGRVPKFAIAPRIVLGNFAYAKLPMVRDLESAVTGLIENEIVAAIAGDPGARTAVIGARPDPASIPTPDAIPLADEYLILDADSSQNYAINATVAGHSLLVNGPPGTGKSQTIANLIATMIARGKRVLFVAEKRAAVDAVTKRLHARGLGDLVMNVHGGVSSRKKFAGEVGAALTASRNTHPVDASQEQRRAESLRAQLIAHEHALHAPRTPWNISVYQLRLQLLDLPAASETPHRFVGGVLDGLAGGVEIDARDELESFARLGGLTLEQGGSPWANTSITTSDDLQAAFGLAQQIASTLAPPAIERLRVVAAGAGVPVPESIGASREFVEACAQLDALLATVDGQIFDCGLDDLLTALRPADGSPLARMFAQLTSSRYREAKRTVRRLSRAEHASAADLLLACKRASQLAGAWHAMGSTTHPAPPAHFLELKQAFQDLLAAAEALAAYVPAAAPMDDRALREVLAHARALVADQSTALKLPELHRLRSALGERGVGPLLADLDGTGTTPEMCGLTFHFAWCYSILDRVGLTDPTIGTWTAGQQERISAEFQRCDREHIESTPARIRRACAERAVAARDEFPVQSQLVTRQANLKSRHMPVRDFFQAASGVLLAIKPCWVMSPLVVSQLLPPQPYFDLVIFDEASQVTPADAIPSILRGKQLVVAGDQHQLPPTAFFASNDPDPDPDPDPSSIDPLAGTQGFESILDVLAPLLQRKTLTWHYRSRDERLIAFSNAHIYDRMLTTFPGIEEDGCLAFGEVSWQAGADTNSPAPEVRHVVDRIIDHARERPGESLGVIAMGVKHADRISESLRELLRDSTGLASATQEFFAEDREEHFFVKNLERVQGDERDAIILSVGYGKNANGSMVYRFGPLNQDGGERRLNVAVTRAKRRMELVASFSAADMDPERSTSAGAKLLRQYVQYVESDGTNLGDVILEKPALNPFEIDIRNHLEAAGLSVTPQYGCSGYWIDFAVKHPTEPARYVLAIECDGATYHSAQSARDRDRLRQQQLETLGWRFHRIWSTEWFYERDKALAKVLDAYHAAVEAADHGNAATCTEPEQPEPSRAPRSAAVILRGPRPRIPRGLPIQEYGLTQLVALVKWIELDGALRTEEELTLAVMDELGFHRRGKQIVATIAQAIDRARQ